VNENMLAAVRNLAVRALVTLPTGTELDLSGADVLSFSIEEGADGALLPGAALSARLTMAVADGGGGRRDVPWVGATAQVFIICEGSELPCGVFAIDSVSAKERSGEIVLSGSDSIASELSGAFEDTLAYPATLGGLWAHLVSQTRYGWSGAVPGGGAVIEERPDWGSITLRRAAGWIAQSAGCFVRAGRTGSLELVPCAGQAAHSLGPEAYLSLDDGFETFGPVAGVRATPPGAEESITVTDGAGEILTVEGNPLLTSGAMVQNMLDRISGLTLEKASFRWRGDPSVGVGSRIALTDTYGRARICTVTRQTLRFEGGFSAECACAVPDTNSGGVVRAITPEGGVNADALVGTVDGGLLRADSVQARSIAAGTITARELAAGSISAGHLSAGSVTADKIGAGSVTADKLAAGSVTADKIGAGSVTAEKLDADTVSARTAEFVAAEIEKLTAADVKADRLYAAFAHIVQLAAGNIVAGSVQADRLSAALARFVSAYAKVGEFDFAEAQNFVAGAMSLEQGAMDTVYIRNLAVTQANLLSATLGKLVLRGDDGRYWRVFIGSDGAVSAEEVTDADAEAGGGRQIVETGMNVGSLNATNLQASSAVINQILTTALRAGSITAADALIASATIPALYATSIQAIGDSLELAVGRKSAVHRSDTPPAQAAEGDLWVQPGTGALYQLAAGGGLPQFWLDGADVYYLYGDGQTAYQLVLDENGDLLIDEAAPFAAAISPDGAVVLWERVKDGELQAGIEENGALIRNQEAKITEMADAIELRVTTEIYEEKVGELEEGVGGNRQLIQKNESAISLLDDELGLRVTELKQSIGDQAALVSENRAAITLLSDEISSRVSQETFEQTADGLRGTVTSAYSELTQRADSMELEMVKKVDGEALRTYIRYEDGAVELGSSESRYTTRTSDGGFAVLQDGAVMTSMVHNAVSAPVIQARRQFALGGFSLRLGANGHLILV